MNVLIACEDGVVDKEKCMVSENICADLLRDKNGKPVMLGDKLSFDGKVGKVIWWSEQERHYIEFEDESRAELSFYTWMHDNFEIVGNTNPKEAIV